MKMLYSNEWILRSMTRRDVKYPSTSQKCESEECVSVFRSFKYYRSGELVHREEKMDMGNTLIHWLIKIEVYFCIV